MWSEIDSDLTSSEEDENHSDAGETQTSMFNENVNLPEDIPLPSNWSEDSRFDEWLAWNNYEERTVKCIWCNSTLQARFPSVFRHYRSAKHTHEYQSRINENAEEFTPEWQQKWNKAVANIGFSVWFVAEDLAFLKANSFIKCIRKNLPDSQIAKDVDFCTDKLVTIIEKVFTPAHQTRLGDILRNG